MTIKFLLCVILIQFSLQAMDFSKDNPEDAVIPKHFVQSLAPFCRYWKNAYGYTPLSLFDMCKRAAIFEDRACEHDEGIKKMPDCLPFAKKARHKNCNRLYKKAVELIKQPTDDKDEQQQINKQIENCFKNCVDSCTTKLIKIANFNETNFDSEVQNYASHYKRIFNYISCRNACAKERYILSYQHKLIERLEQAHLNEAAQYNEMAKKMYTEK